MTCLHLTASNYAPVTDLKSCDELSGEEENTLCDETCTPLLDQGVVEASGSLTLLTFAVEKIRADSSSFKRILISELNFSVLNYL